MDAKKGMVKKGTHFLFSTTPEGKLAVEGEAQGSAVLALALAVLDPPRLWLLCLWPLCLWLL